MGSEVSCCADIKNNGEETDDEQFRDSEDVHKYEKESKNNLNITSKLTPISLVAQHINTKVKRSRRKKQNRPRSRSDNKYTIRHNEQYTPCTNDNTPSLGSSDSLSSIYNATGGMSPLSTLSDSHANIILSYSDCSFPMSVPCQTRSCSVPMMYSNNSNNSLYNLQEENEEIECDCVENCVAIKRVINALQIYSKYISKTDVLTDKYKNNNELINDYQHVLDCHLSQEYDMNMGTEFALIQQKINKQIKKTCEINKCEGHKRYVQCKKYGESGETIVDILDSMHCFLIHSNNL